MGECILTRRGKQSTIDNSPITLLSGSNQATSVTGGWQAVATSCLLSEAFDLGTISFSSSGATLTFANSSAGHFMGSGFATKNKVDIKRLTKLTWTWNGDSGPVIALTESYSNHSIFTAVAQASVTAQTLDISNLYGKTYYIIICYSDNIPGGNISGVINNIKLI